MTIEALVAHERLVDSTYARLEAKDDHRTIKLVKHWSYRCCECGADGELDIVAYRGRVRTYYEIKSHYSPVSYVKALEQFARAQRTFPKSQWKFVFVSPELTKRVRQSEVLRHVRTN